MQKAATIGSFDPPTLGHWDSIQRASHLYDKLIVGVGVNPSKSGLLTPEQRVQALEAMCAGLDNVSVAMCTGLAVDFAADHQATVLVKGVRNSEDAQYELGMAQMNRALHAGIETVLLPADPALSMISSTLVRDIWQHDGDISAFVSPAVLALMQAWKG